MKKIGLYIGIGIIVIMAIIILFQCVYTVREDQYACVVRFSKIVDVAPSRAAWTKYVGKPGAL